MFGITNCSLDAILSPVPVAHLRFIHCLRDGIVPTYPAHSGSLIFMTTDDKHDSDDMGSISKLIFAVKQDEHSTAAAKLWQHFFERLHAVAQKKFGANGVGEADGEDAAVMAFHALLEGVNSGRFDAISNRDEFWKLLVTIANRNVLRILRRDNTQRRGGDQQKTELQPDQIGNLDDDPMSLAELEDTIRFLAKKLPSDRYRRVMNLRLAGYSVDDIAEKTDQSPTSVRRQLKTLREHWKKL